MKLIVIMAVAMGVLSGIFWIMEAHPAFKNVLKIPRPRATLNPFVLFFDCARYAVLFLGALLSAWRLPLDVACTLFLAKMFGLGGIVGTMIGLSVSNVISVYLLFKIKGANHEERSQPSNAHCQALPG